MKKDSVFDNAQQRAAHWRRVKRLTRALLAVWFVLTFCIIFFARELSSITVFGWPLSFYMAAQGLVLVYLALTAFYAWRMRRFDKRAQAGMHDEQ